MVDHRGTPSQRAYQLPGWFFVLTVTLSVSALAVVGWIFFADRLDLGSDAPQAAASPSVTASGSELDSRPTEPAASPSAEDRTDDDPARPDIEVVVLNASKTPGLAATVAEAAEGAGWTVGEVGNWIYPAVVNAVYYPEGRQREAELLAEDLEIESVRPARAGMSTSELTVLLVYSP